VSDQLNQWMAAERQAIEAKRGADRSRESNLLNFEKDQRARQSSGTYRASVEWSGPPRSKLDDFVSRELRGIDPDAGTREPAPEHLAAVAGEWPEAEEDAVREAAWASLDPETQAAGLDVGGPGFPAAAQAFDNAVVAAREAASRANAEQMHRDAMARDPDTYGRP
jgi:hypothetical protein